MPPCGIFICMTYAEKLKDPRWQKKRLEILNRDEFTCQYCFSQTETLHVHHLQYIYSKEPWDYDNKFLITYCKKCHDDITKFDKQANAIIISELMVGLNNPFIKGCAVKVFESYDINNLIYFLWEQLDDMTLFGERNELNPRYFKKSDDNIKMKS